MAILELVGRLTALAGFTFAVLFWIAQRSLPVVLEVEPPAVVEFRCQSMSFDATRCFSAAPGKANLSLSVALKLTAQGPSVQSVAVDQVTAEVQLPASRQLHRSGVPERRQLRLSAYWSGNLTGGAPSFEQAVSQNLSGRQTMRREYWLMPVAREACKAGTDFRDPACQAERSDFLSWSEFVRRMLAAALEEEAEDPAEITVEFRIDYRRRGLPVEPVTFSCRLQLGATAWLALRDPEYPRRPGAPLYLALPCHPEGAEPARWSLLHLFY